MDDPNPPPPPPPPPKDKKTLKEYIASLTRKVSQKTALGAQHLGTLARSATISRSRNSKARRNSILASSTSPTTTTTTSAPKKDTATAPRLPNIVYRSPDADFIESHMEASIRSIGADIEAEKEIGKEGDDRMGGYTIRLIDPRTNGN
ncbi:hypothetical protein TWF281_003791 [Arthrobotrys megalospora]